MLLRVAMTSVALAAGVGVGAQAWAQPNGTAYCVRTSAYATALRGPNYSTASAENGCGDYRTQSADPNNSSEAGFLDPTYLTAKYTRAQAGGYRNTADGPIATASFAGSSANLADATVRAFGNSTLGAQGSAFARWDDRLNFTNTTGVEQFIRVYWTVEGVASFDPESVGGVSSAFEISARNQSGSSNGGFYYGLSPQGQLETRTQNAAPNFESNFTVRDLGGVSREFSSLFGVGAGLSAVDILAQLSVDARQGSTADFGNTGKFRFGALPDGVSFTSDSGVFATIPNIGGVGGVPEPATWALMILGFGAIGAAMRRRTPAARVRFA